MISPVSVDAATNGAKGMANGAMDQGSAIISDILGYLGSTLGFIKPALVALAILIIGGWIIKKVMGLLKTGLEKAKIDTLVEKTGLTGELAGLGINVTASSLITGVVGVVAKFVLYMAAINALGIDALTQLMNDILAYIPNVIVALILLFAGLTIAKFVKDLIEKSASSLSVSADTAKLLGKIAKIAILVMTVLAVLNQLNIAKDLVNTLFQGAIYGLTIAGGLAFGLGGQEKAKEIINKICK